MTILFPAVNKQYSVKQVLNEQRTKLAMYTCQLNATPGGRLSMPRQSQTFSHLFLCHLSLSVC